MKKLLWIPVAVALATAGCILVSGQFVVDYDLGTVNAPSATLPVPIDLNTRSEYADHKDKIKDLSDLSLLGVITNNSAAPLQVTVYMTPNATTYVRADDVRASGVLLWGPYSLAASATRRIDWDTSAGLFSATGKAALMHEVKGDGQFTLYLVGQGTSYSFTATDARLVLVLDAGV